MGYLFLLIALLAGVTKGVCGKKISGQVLSLKGLFYVNFIRMVLCVAIGFFIIFFNDLSEMKINPYTLLITSISGLSTALFIILWIISVRKGAYVMVEVFVMLGSIVPIILSNVFFNEAITIYRGVGFLLLLCGSYIMCSYSSNIKGNFSLDSLIILLMCCLCNGLSDFTQKWFVYTIQNGSVAVFNFYTYIFSALVLLIFFGISNKIEKKENDGNSAKNFIIMCVMAVCLFTSLYCKTTAAKYIESSILYPLLTGASIIVNIIIASAFFGEKITKKCTTGILVTFVAMIVMNL